MKIANLVFPHQLFEDHPLLANADGTFYLIEEHLFFRQYKFHKQKIAYHRATMQAFADYLRKKGRQVSIIESTEKSADARNLGKYLSAKGVDKIRWVETSDNYLERRLMNTAKENGFEIEVESSPMWINTKKDLEAFFKKEKKKFHQTTFYKSERKRLGILVDDKDEPAGGDWTYDKANREKYPKDKTPPKIHYPRTNDYYKEAIRYVEKHYSDNPGELPDSPLYPMDYGSTERWWKQFLENRLDEFGPYEDAIVQEESILNHSVMTPMLNIGLITPKTIIEEVTAYAEKHNIRINSTEGFIRQIIGWREFIRGIYLVKGSEERTKNFWGFNRKIPKSFYDGTTGIDPVDKTIKKVLNTGYCHHIERLMILGNIMLLCEFDPDEVYRWFMELFIDAFDWVMVPNVYGMTQFADGGLMSTKPYISSSNYIKKMSDYGSGDWTAIWDGLFWRFLCVHREFFEKNGRMRMLISSLDKMGEEKLNGHLENAEGFLAKIDT